MFGGAYLLSGSFRVIATDARLTARFDARVEHGFNLVPQKETTDFMIMVEKQTLLIEVSIFTRTHIKFWLSEIYDTVSP